MSKLKDVLHLVVRRWVSSHAALLLWLIAAAHLLVYAFVQTIWSRVDEAQHFHYVQYLAENRALPVTGKTFISKDVVRVSQIVDQWGWNPARTVDPPSVLDPQEWQTIPEYLEGEERLDWIAYNLWYFNYEAMQPPFYYSLGALVYLLIPGDAFLHIYVLRAFSALIASLTVPLAYATLREGFPASRLSAAGVAAAIALLPGFVLNLSQVTNDSLATTLATFCLYLLVRGTVRGFSGRNWVLVGLVIGLSLWTKVTTVFLIPLAFVALLLSNRGVQWRILTPVGIKLGVMLVSLPVLIFSPWLLRNLVVYGDLLGSAAATELLGAIFRPVKLDSIDAVKVHISTSLDHMARTFWFGEPFPPWHFWESPFAVINTLLLLSAFGLFIHFCFLPRREEKGPKRVVALMAAAVIFQIAEVLIGPTFGGLGVVGRYLYPSIVPVLSLMWLGLASLTRKEAHVPILIILIGGLLVLDVLNYIWYMYLSYVVT